MREITNTDDIIDSRDVIERIAELEDGSLACELDEDERDEHEALKSLAEWGEGCADWHDGAVLIRDSYFTTYAQDFATEIGRYDPSKYEWPLSCIDWDQAASELQQDYTSVEFDGVSYWVR